MDGKTKEGTLLSHGMDFAFFLFVIFFSLLGLKKPKFDTISLMAALLFFLLQFFLSK